MRKYYEKLERNEYLRGHTDGHGQDGWLGTNALNPSLLVEDTKSAYSPNRCFLELFEDD